MRLRLLSPKGILFEGEVSSCVVPGEKGPTYFSTDTTRMLVGLLPSGVLNYASAKGGACFACFGGFARKDRDTLTVASPLMEEGSSIDAARAEESKRRAEKRLAEKKEGLDEARARASLARALTRLEVKSRSGGSQA